MRSRLRGQPGDRWSDSLLRPVRAPRFSIFRPCLRRVHRPRAHHRDLQTDPSGSAVRAAVHGAGTDGQGDHGGAIPGAAGAWGGGLPRGHPSVHPDAWRARVRIDHAHHLLAGQLRVEPGAARGISEHRPVARQRAPFLNPLNRLFDISDRSEAVLPPPLAELYDGDLWIPDAGGYANFVSSIDGIVALEGGTAPSGGIISGRNQGDRFVMGLLRAFADAVLVGAGTVRAEGGRALWTPEFIFPAAADGYRELRRALKRASTPRLVIVTARGGLNPNDRALEVGAFVLTTEAAAARLRNTLPSATEVRAIATGNRIEVDVIFDALRSDGLQTILTEGGPHLFGQLVMADRIDELFLTVSPALAGRRGDQSFGLVQGVDFGRSPKPGRLL